MSEELPILDSNLDTLVELIMSDEIEIVKEQMGVDPTLFQENTKIIKYARTLEMARTLLQIEKIEKLGVSRDSAEQRAIILAIKQTFSTILKRWPSIAVEVLDNHIKYDGLSAEDPQLTVFLDFSILRETSSGIFNDPKKIPFLRLSDLDPHLPTTDLIVFHPVVVTFVHLRGSNEDMGRHIIKLLYLLLVMMTSFIMKYDNGVKIVCDGFVPAYYMGYNVYLASSFSVFIIASVNAVMESIRFYILRKRCRTHFIFQVLLILLLVNIIRPERNTSGLWLPCINLLLIANLYLSLSVSSLCGKFILITRKVLHTFWSVLTPVAFVILVLGLSEFTVRYEQQLQAAQGKRDGATKLTLLDTPQSDQERAEVCGHSFPMMNNHIERHLEMYVKSVLYVVSVLYGEVEYVELEIKSVGKGGKSEVINRFISWAINWLTTTTLLAIIVMNLLVAFTMQDVKEMEKLADCRIVQLQIQNVCVKRVSQSIMAYVAYHLYRPKPVKKAMGTHEIVTLYPNKNKRGCIVLKQKGIVAKLIAKFTSDYILGCHSVRNLIIQKFHKPATDYTTNHD